MVRAVTRPILIRKAIEFAAAIAAGIGLWRFTSGDWLSGIVFVVAIGGLSVWYLWKSRRVGDGGRRY
jgi:hypothetical protein